MNLESLTLKKNTYDVRIAATIVFCQLYSRPITEVTLMAVFSWGARGKGGHNAIPIGALLIFLSDIAISRNRFVGPQSMDWFWDLPLNYIGQLFLAYSVSTIPSRTIRIEAQTL